MSKFTSLAIAAAITSFALPAMAQGTVQRLHTSHVVRSHAAIHPVAATTTAPITAPTVTSETVRTPAVTAAPLASTTPATPGAVIAKPATTSAAATAPALKPIIKAN